MPELPEVETVRRDLVKLFAGARLSSVSVTGRRTVRRHPPQLLEALEGQTLADVRRHGKYLFFDWEGGDVMVGHLRMSGQLLWSEPGGPLPAHAHAVFCFAGAGELRFVDPRTFGEIFLLGSAAAGYLQGLGAPGLGPDALVVSPTHLQGAFAGRRAPVKAVLVDQRAVAGIGNIYADEICFAARVRGDKPAGAVRRAQIGRLAEATHEVLEAAIEARGSTLPDLGYRDLAGLAGNFQLQHKVYGRLGLPCYTCGRPIVRLHFGARSAFICTRCQK